jgi:glycosyltransferase involved in cell wall biosynthesis
MPYPAVGGDRSRVFHFIRALARANHEVHLLTFDARASHASMPAALAEHLESHRTVPLPSFVSALQAFVALGGKRPLQVAYYDSPAMEVAVRETLDRVKPDVVYTHLFRMAPYSLQSMRGHPAAWVLDLTDVISSEIRRSLPFRKGADRWLYTLEGRRIARYEEEIAPRFDRCWVISDAESRMLASMAPAARVEVVPIGIDRNGDHDAGTPEREPATILFFGYQKIAHNRDAARFLAEEILPIVRRSAPEAVLEIAGQGAASLGSWSRGAGIRNLGYVASPQSVLARATVFVAPLRFAAGVQTKVLQALDAGLPVVTTPLVLEGLEPIPEGIVRVGATAEEIAAHVVDLLRHPDSALELGRRGRAWVRERFTWDHAVHAFESLAGVKPSMSLP